jgi:hypothetical protein
MMFVSFLIVTYFSGQFILASLNTNGFRKNHHSFKKVFWSYVLLSIIFAGLGVIATGPLYAIVVTIYTGIPYGAFISGLLLVLFFLLVLLFTLWFMLTPYLMLDKHLSLRHTLSKTFALIRKKELLLLQRVVMLFIFFLPYQAVYLTFTLSVPALTPILELLLLFFIIPFVVSFGKVTYNDIAS